MLKPIPVEHAEHAESASRKNVSLQKKSLKPKPISQNGSNTLRTTGLTLLNFFKKGFSFTVSQIDELIMALQRAILQLQKRKQSLLSEEKCRLDELEKRKKVKFRKRKI